MSPKVRTTITGVMAASLFAVTAIPAAAIVAPHGGHGHGPVLASATILPHGGHGGHGGGCFVKGPVACQ
jgi:hypothetical protein